MRGRAKMSCDIVALFGKLFGGALLIASTRISSSTDGLTKMANGFPAGMSAIRNRYLNGMFAISGRRVIEEKTENGSKD